MLERWDNPLLETPKSEIARLPMENSRIFFKKDSNPTLPKKEPVQVRNILAAPKPTKLTRGFPEGKNESSAEACSDRETHPA